jgi:hypothetical protein
MVRRQINPVSIPAPAAKRDQRDVIGGVVSLVRALFIRCDAATGRPATGS